MRSSRTRDRTCVSCIGRQILYHWATITILYHWKPSELFFRLTKINRAQSKVKHMLAITIRRLNVCLVHVTVLRPNASCATRTALSALVRYLYVFKLLSRLWEGHQEETVSWPLRQGESRNLWGMCPHPPLELSPPVRVTLFGPRESTPGSLLELGSPTSGI